MMKMILHAGVHKTGTTTLQHFAREHSARLAEQSLIYPDWQPASSDKRWASHNWVAQKLTGAYPEFSADFPSTIEFKMRGVDTTVLVSFEDMSACCEGYRLWQGLDQENFRELQRRYLRKVASFFNDFDIEALLVFRRADEFAQSLYQTLIKGGHYRGGFAEFLHYAAPLFDFSAQRKAFEEVFGNLKVISYHQLGGCATKGLLKEIGVELDNNLIISKNVSTDARLAFWMQHRNSRRVDFSELTALEKRFCGSTQARLLFPDFGLASFWKSQLERNAFHAKSANGFSEGFFPNSSPHSGVEAYLDDKELERISTAFESWVNKRKRNPIKSAKSSIWRRLKEYICK
jgi:hypothetical protein